MGIFAIRAFQKSFVYRLFEQVGNFSDAVYGLQS